MEPTAVPTQLQSCQYVYVQGDGARLPLTARYDSPFLVVAKAAKHFKIQKGA
jgi:hypothetical protein